MANTDHLASLQLFFRTEECQNMVDDYGSSIMIMARDRKVACEHADVAVIHHQLKVFRLSTTNKRLTNT